MFGVDNESFGADRQDLATNMKKSAFNEAMGDL
jgi:hypothetical protein